MTKPMLSAPINPTAGDAAACSDLLTAIEALIAETMTPFFVRARDGRWGLHVAPSAWEASGLAGVARPYDREGVIACREGIEDGTFDWPWEAPESGIVTRAMLYAGPRL